MRFMGPARRARDLRSAANRLRWEVDWALGIALGVAGPYTRASRPYEAEAVVGEIAETLAILRHTLTAIDAHLPPYWAEGARARLATELEFYARYHETAR